MTTVAANTLTREEVAYFHENGFAGPFKLCEPDEMDRIRARIETEVLAVMPPTHAIVEQCRHLDCRVVYDLCSHQAIVERMASIMGPDLVLWRSHFYCKNPGDLEIPWHQDFGYWALNPAINISAWVAIDASTVENSCVQIIPGSHNSEIGMVQSPPGMQFPKMADPRFVDVSKKIDMPLKPGEFFIFNEKTLHHSELNRSDKRRLGLAVRVTLPSVKVDHTELVPGHRVMQLCGEDRHGLNQMMAAPL